MRLLLDATVERGNHIGPMMPKSWARYASPWLQTVHVAAIGPTMRSVDQLRYRSAVARPGSFSTDMNAVARRLAKTPAVIWPRWEARLEPPSQVHRHLSQVRRHLGIALSAVLMPVDSNVELTPVVTRHTGGLIDSATATRLLQALRDTPQWNDIQVALIRLAEYLDSHEVPIDYARRRRLDYTDLLSERDWVNACGRAVHSPGTGTRYHVARWFLFERVSGLPGSRGPHRPPQSVSFGDYRNRFPYLLTPELLAELDWTARRFLSRQGIDDEPLTWEPPADLLAGLDLPRVDPDLIDLAGLHRLVSAGQRPTRIVRALGADLRTLRLVLSERPAPSPGASSKQRHLSGMQRARKELPWELLERLYVHQCRSFLEIAKQTGVRQQHVARLADEYGLPRHAPRPRRGDGTPIPRELLDRDWLYEQYIERHRSFKEIGQELGVVATTVSGWARKHEIPYRSNRHRSRPELDVEKFPELLRPVLGSDYPLRRLQTFLQIAGYRSLADACAALALCPFSVYKQLHRLEQDLGGPVLLRAVKNRPMEPTELGHRVLTAALPLAELLGLPAGSVQVAPPSPGQTRKRRPRTTTAPWLKQFPTLLRPVLGTKGGRRRLRRFMEAARYPSLTAFARATGLTPSTVTQQVCQLERDLDGELLTRCRRGDAMSLTSLDRKVLAAAQPYADQLGDLHGPRHRTPGPGRTEPPPRPPFEQWVTKNARLLRSVFDSDR
ncbi:helix-turn-helix domain-containing protein [Streptomyces puniciscabiei]|uniref:helix-turn-helix domain-containing protein n=1 Tax=Streptomyces puniciscabiei TaxID=164348 RepID=UPI0033253C58